ncbi:hypothetical protein SALWKB12_1226 [Snodgrassella communis]|uniref:hypothetical protein n=1 Tax=Snodgrassella communis TaxID=2946699 RepID=UPI000461D283|nr:hypothetical protein [Snodgrassella communis]KDN12702.1 hypothetical protein SALWKB12_1226 [Snodgrassella communis]
MKFEDFLAETKAKIKTAKRVFHYLIKIHGCGGAICGGIKNLRPNKVIILPKYLFNLR